MSKTPMQLKELMADTTPATPTVKVGTFIVFDTQQVKGLRVNIEKIRNYAISGEDSIQISYDNAGSTVLKFRTMEEQMNALARLDSFCL